MIYLLKQVILKYWFIKQRLMIFWVMSILLTCFKDPKNIKSMLRPVEYVPETMFAKDVSERFNKKTKEFSRCFR